MRGRIHPYIIFLPVDVFGFEHKWRCKYNSSLHKEIKLAWDSPSSLDQYTPLRILYLLTYFIQDLLGIESYEEDKMFRHMTIHIY